MKDFEEGDLVPLNYEARGKLSDSGVEVQSLRWWFQRRPEKSLGTTVCIRQDELMVELRSVPLQRWSSAAHLTYFRYEATGTAIASRIVSASGRRRWLAPDNTTAG